MPTVEVHPDELRRLTGHDEKDDDQLKSDLFALGLEFEGETEEGAFELEFAPDRLDRLSVEGVARSLRYQYGDDRGVSVPKTNDPDWTFVVDEAVPDERPYVTGAIVRGVNLDEKALQSLIQVQEKLHATMGRDRAKGAIGIHDLTMLKGAAGTAEAGEQSIRYTGVEPDGDTFVPLDSDEEMTPGEVLERHPIGDKYAPIVADYERLPAIYDDVGLFSFPPVINGRRTEVTTDSRDLLIEMTGTDQWTIDHMLNIVCYALAARGATIEQVEVEYPEDDAYPLRELVRPDFEVDQKVVTHDRIERIIGIDLDVEAVVDLAERAGLEAEPEEYGEGEVEYVVSIPPYRVDVLHPLDVIDDIGRAYGFNDLEPRYPDVSTVGGRHERSRLERAVRETLVGLGFEDLLNFYLISEVANFDRMNVEPDDDAVGGGEPATIAEPYSEEYEVVRTWALPSIMLVLENNTHRAYPQDVAEIGLAAEVDPSENTGVAERRTVAGALARTDASYEDAKSRLQAVARRFEVDLETPATDHPTFVEGRAAEVVMDGEPVGVIGEVAPEVLVEFDLEVPVAAFEFRLDALE
ncbi:MAG TPA: phenylalanine--tRNA ligase subunit beta [Halobacteriales archaeon]|nr:phenylalanine--tRNA ligase subunit beta [Halobacteriales archaeon]